MNLSNYAENMLLNFVLNNQTVVRPSSWYVGLFTDPAGLTSDQPSTELVGSGYARQSATFLPSNNGATSNSNTVIFSATGLWPTATYVGIFDNSTGGNLLFWTPFQSPITLDNAGQILFAINTIIASMD